MVKEDGDGTLLFEGDKVEGENGFWGFEFWLRASDFLGETLVAASSPSTAKASVFEGG